MGKKKRSARITPKALVLRRYPYAFSKQGFMSGDWHIWSHPEGGQIIGAAETPKVAWLDAALYVRRYER